MDESYFYLAFSNSPGIGPKRFLTILKKFGTSEKGYKGTEKEYEEIGIKEKTYLKFDEFRKQFNIENYKKLLEKANVEFIAQCDLGYPKSLLQLEDPPIVLYAKGNIDLLNCHSGLDPESKFETNLNDKIPHQVRDDKQKNNGIKNDRKIIAVVGTRKVTSYGQQVTESLVSNLANSFTIISGLALGVDAIAHKASLENNGSTIAILGCGVDCCFPRENQNLYNAILKKGGLIISEYPLGTQPSKGSFPARNRIIAALSIGVLITEAGADSGSLITADYGLKLNKKIFAVPGPITSRQSDGTSYLLKNGAKLVQNVDDIIQELGVKNYESKARQTISLDNLNVSDVEKKVLQLLQDEGLTMDSLSKKTSIPVHSLSMILSSLEVQGYIKNAGNGVFEIT